MLSFFTHTYLHFIIALTTPAIWLPMRLVQLMPVALLDTVYDICGQPMHHCEELQCK